MAAEHAHGLFGGGAHGGQAKTLYQLANHAVRGFTWLDNARRDAQRPSRGRNQQCSRLGFMVQKVTLAELVFDQLVGRRGIRYAQKSFGQYHKRQAFGR